MDHIMICKNSPGHGPWSHSFSSAGSPSQNAPPFKGFGSVQDLARILFPFPHVASHADHGYQLLQFPSTTKKYTASNYYNSMVPHRNLLFLIQEFTISSSRIYVVYSRSWNCIFEKSSQRISDFRILKLGTPIKYSWRSIRFSCSGKSET